MKKVIAFLVPCLIFFSAAAKSSLKLTVNARQYDRENSIVMVDISQLGLTDGKSVELFETTNGAKVLTPSQVVIEKNKNATIYFILSNKTPKGSFRTYTVKKTNGEKQTGEMQLVDDEKALTIKSNGKSVLSYNYTLSSLPEGVDEIFRRSGYIHPAYTPSGYVLTEIQPTDHRHHYGIWNPWTKIQYEEAIYDLWNLGSNQGTVRSKDILSRYNGSVMAGFDASLDHIIKRNGGETKIMDEIWKIKAWNVGGGFLWDFESVLTPSTESPVLIKEYRYAGFGFRANTHWTRENTEMMTSEGLTRKQIDGSRGRWIYVNGDTDSGKGGILFMDRPENYNFPEPFRIWGEDANSVGHVFVNFAPTKNKDWELKPGNTYKLLYRVMTYDGTMTPERAESLWIDFAYPVDVVVK